MEFIELSIENLKEKNNELYKKIKKEYDYDLVIFVAKGSYLIGKELADLNNVSLIEIKATREGGKLKKLLSPILMIIPNRLKLFLRTKELNSNHHQKNSDRKINFDENMWKKYKDVKKILLVDDSVDTGYSIKLAKEAIQKYFKEADIKVATYNVFDSSKENVEIDYTLHKNTIIKGPWSNDSKEHTKYLKLYNTWKRSD